SAPSGKRFVTWSRTISATVSPLILPVSRLALDRARRQPSDDSALEEHYEDDDRNGDDDRGGRDRTGGNRKLRAAAEVRDGGWRRPGCCRRGERYRQQE